MGSDKKNIFKVIAVLSFLVLVGNAIGVFADESGQPGCGGGLAGQVLIARTNDGPGGNVECKEKAELPQQDETFRLNRSDLIGDYVLHGFRVEYDTGDVLTSDMFSFSGTMIISDLRVTQQMTIAGTDIVAGGSWQLNGNTLIMHNDYVSWDSILSFTWDGTFLATTIYFTNTRPYYTETDVWRKISSPTPSPTDPYSEISGLTFSSSKGRVGSPITITATANGAGLYYKFWANTANFCEHPDSPQWVVLRDWSASNIFTWTPTVTGFYTIVVWISSDPNRLCTNLIGAGFKVE